MSEQPPVDGDIRIYSSRTGNWEPGTKKHRVIVREGERFDEQGNLRVVMMTDEEILEHMTQAEDLITRIDREMGSLMDARREQVALKKKLFAEVAAREKIFAQVALERGDGER
jgi:hypothetical protein